MDRLERVMLNNLWSELHHLNLSALNVLDMDERNGEQEINQWRNCFRAIQTSLPERV
jgi:hypothetical protein